MEIAISPGKKLSSKLGRFTMNRNGQFIFKTKEPTDHCGIGDAIPCKYDIKAVCGTKLNDKRFLVDQLSIDRVFQDIRITTQSCEDLAAHCLHEVVIKIMEENPQCHIHSIEVTLSPFPHQASISLFHIFKSKKRRK